MRKKWVALLLGTNFLVLSICEELWRSYQPQDVIVQLQGQGKDRDNFSLIWFTLIGYLMKARILWMEYTEKAQVYNVLKMTGRGLRFTKSTAEDESYVLKRRGMVDLYSYCCIKKIRRPCSLLSNLRLKYIKRGKTQGIHDSRAQIYWLVASGSDNIVWHSQDFTLWYNCCDSHCDKLLHFAQAPNSHRTKLVFFLKLFDLIAN